MAKPKLLIVEDDEGLCSQYRWAFPTCEVLIAHARPQAVALVKREYPPVAIMDLGLPPDPDGVSERFATLSEVLWIAPQDIIVTGNGERKNALPAVAAGAYNFCEKPVEIDLRNAVRGVPQNAEAHYWLGRVIFELGDPVAWERERRSGE